MAVRPNGTDAKGRCAPHRLRPGQPACRVGTGGHPWYDLDFPEVIAERRKYYCESGDYHMLCADARRTDWMDAVPAENGAIVVMEGVSMYLTNDQVRQFLQALERKYARLHILMDVYTEFGARASKYKNPVNSVGVTQLYGVDDIGALLGGTGIHLKAEHSFTPERLVGELRPAERALFQVLFAEGLYRKIYRLYELERGE